MILPAQTSDEVTQFYNDILSCPGAWCGAFRATFVIWREQNYGKVRISVSLDFLDNRSALVGLLVQNDWLGAKPLHKAGHRFARTFIVTMHHKGLGEVACFGLCRRLVALGLVGDLLFK